MQWRDNLYIRHSDTIRPKVSPKKFSAVADALEWILQQAGVTFVLHYLDDYLTMSKKQSNECEHNLNLIKGICSHLGLPLKVEKLEGPKEVLIFLGISMDTIRMELRLPGEKLAELKNITRQWKLRKASTKRELLNLNWKVSPCSKNC